MNKLFNAIDNHWQLLTVGIIAFLCLLISVVEKYSQPKI